MDLNETAETLVDTLISRYDEGFDTKTSLKNLLLQTIEPMIKRIEQLEAVEIQLRSVGEEAYEQAKKIYPSFDWRGFTKTPGIAVMALGDLIGKLNSEISKNIFDSIDKYELLEEKCKSFEGSFNSATKSLANQMEIIDLLTQETFTYKKKIKAMESVIYAVGDYASGHKDDRYGSRRRLLEAYEKYINQNEVTPRS